jgi:hypothetical protein
MREHDELVAQLLVPKQDALLERLLGQRDRDDAA